jgi:hypothetical protein
MSCDESIAGKEFFRDRNVGPLPRRMSTPRRNPPAEEIMQLGISCDRFDLRDDAVHVHIEARLQYAELTHSGRPLVVNDS